jgi:hypothetical protein
MLTTTLIRDDVPLRPYAITLRMRHSRQILLKNRVPSKLHPHTQSSIHQHVATGDETRSLTRQEHASIRNLLSLAHPS